MLSCKHGRECRLLPGDGTFVAMCVRHRLVPNGEGTVSLRLDLRTDFSNFNTSWSKV